MEIPLLRDIVAVFCLSIGVLLAFYRLHVPPIVGFLLTGVLSGPSALGLVQDMDAVELVAEFGVVLLLFTLGLEMSGKELARLRKPVLVGGPLQVGLTVLVFIGVTLLFGGGAAEGVFYGCLVALSSTALVMGRMQQQAQTESPQGRLILAVLLFQDIVTVPMMLAIPLLAGRTQADPASLLLSIGRTVVILGGGWILARHVVPRIMDQVMRTRSPELLLTTTLGLCLAIAMGTASLGLSLALGAFLAGLLLAGSEYSLSVVEGVLPFKNVFTSLFFISVGMLLDLSFFAQHLVEVLILVALIIGVKALMAFPAMLAVGYPVRVSVLSAVSLAQIGEFSFVLAKSGVDNGLMSNVHYQVFLAASILTMMLTPGLMTEAPKVAVFAARLASVFGFTGAAENDEPEGAKPNLRDHLIIVGFGVGGQYLARTARESGIAYVILEMNPDTVRRYGGVEPIHQGDASSPLVLEHFGVREARVIAVVISDPAAVRGITSNAHKLNPKLHIVVRTRFLGEVRALRELGASDVIPEDFETSIEIFTRVLGHYLVPRQSIERFVNSIRRENYAMSRKLGVRGTDIGSLEQLDGDMFSGLEVASVTVEAGSTVAGKRLAEIPLRQEHGVTVVGVRRQDEVIATPDGDTRLLGGDTAYLFARPEALSSVLPLFRVEGDGTSAPQS